MAVYRIKYEYLADAVVVVEADSSGQAEELAYIYAPHPIEEITDVEENE